MRQGEILFQPLYLGPGFLEAADVAGVPGGILERGYRLLPLLEFLLQLPQPLVALAPQLIQ